MTILSIETSTEVCSAALSIGGVTVASRIQTEGCNHAALLPVFVENMIAEARERGVKVEAVALSEGPGSYTGLRIATSTAKGLCYGWNVPLLHMPTTRVLCAAFAAQHQQTLPTDALLCPMIDARRMEVYTALYDLSLNEVAPVQAMVVEADSWLEQLATHPIYFFGNGALKCADVIQNANAHFVDGILPDAQYMGILAEQSDCERVDGNDLAYFEPLYVKEFVAAPSHVKGLK